MRFAVLVKVVPRSEALGYDRAARRTVREDVPLVINPFDQRALRVALELRRPSDSVTAISMGPPGAEGPLREVRAMGVDRVIWLVDPRFSGSDTLATARTLGAALRPAEPDVVLAGARSTDSDTGQVGAEVAELLDAPLLSEARSLSRPEDGARFEVTVDTPHGWALYRVAPPFVLTVGEKIAKPLKVAPEAVASVPASALERRTAEALGLPPGATGDAGSPTVVVAVETVARARRPVVFAEGPIAARVEGAVRALLPRLAHAPEPTRPVPAPPPTVSEEREVLVLVTGPDGALDPSSLAVISEVRRALPGHWPSAVWIGPAAPDEAATFRLEAAGALAGYYAPTEAPELDPGTASRALVQTLAGRPRCLAAIVLSEPFGREVAGRAAGRQGLGLVGDAVAVRPDPTYGSVWSKPSFGGAAVASIGCRTRPALASVRPGVFPPPEGTAPGGGFGWKRLSTVRGRPRVERRAEGRETDLGLADLPRYPVVVALGMGVGGREGIDRIRRLVAPWPAALVATRRVVDQGWFPRQLQVGLTGHAISPRLGVLLGVSGSPNHLIGWQRASALLAVNSEPSAPVFAAVDVGIVGRWEEALPPLVDALRPALRTEGRG